MILSLHLAKLARNRNPCDLAPLRLCVAAMAFFRLNGAMSRSLASSQGTEACGLVSGRGQTGDLPREELMLGGVTQGSGCGGLAGVFSCCPLSGRRPAEPASPADGGVAFLSIRFPVARHGWV